MGIMNAAANKGRFFSVKHSCAIGGQNFRPAVCYRLTGDLQKAVEEMQGNELARIYPAEVRFVSGVAYPIQKPAALRQAVTAATAGSPGVGTGSSRKRGRREFL
jgi:hypothetical protein